MRCVTLELQGFMHDEAIDEVMRRCMKVSLSCGFAVVRERLGQSLWFVVMSQ
jgi:hypothetical protein